MVVGCNSELDLFFLFFILFYGYGYMILAFVDVGEGGGSCAIGFDFGMCTYCGGGGSF